MSMQFQLVLACDDCCSLHADERQRGSQILNDICPHLFLLLAIKQDIQGTTSDSFQNEETSFRRTTHWFDGNVMLSIDF